MTEAEYREWYSGKPRARVVEIGTVKRVPPPSPGPTREPEPTVEIRLKDVASNADFESVEGRRGMTYNLSKRKWTSVAIPDAWIIMGSEDVPSKYPYLIFEKRKPKKRRGKK